MLNNYNEHSKIVKRFLLEEYREPSLSEYLFTIFESLDKFNPSKTSDKSRLSVLKENVRKARKQARLLEENLKILQEQVNLIEETKNNVKECK